MMIDLYQPIKSIYKIRWILNTLFKIVKPKTVELDIPTVIETKEGLFEEVSDLNGLAIPAMYYDHLSDEGTTNVLYEMILIIMDELKDSEHAFLKTKKNSKSHRIFSNMIFAK